MIFPSTSEMILGKITGKASTTTFHFSVTNPKARKYQFIQINHPEYGFVLGQITELERTSEEMTAHCNVVGYKDSEGRIKGIRTPFSIGTEILEAEDEFIKEVVRLHGEGAYIGNLEGKNIPINVSLQQILTKHLAVLAKSGAGKSYAVGCLVEEIMEKNVPLLVIDPHGEYSTMKFPSEENKENLERWNIIAKGYSDKIQEYGDIKIKEDLRPLKLNERMGRYELMKLLPLQLTNTQEAILFSAIKDLDEITLDNIILGLEQLNSSTKWSLIDTLMYLRNLELFSSSYTSFNELIQSGKCSVINLKGISPEVQDVIVCKLLKDLFMARKREKIPPFFCVIEEAHNFVPEKGFGKAKSAEVIRLISSEGRKFGLGLCVVSQRPALVQKTVLAQCSTQIIMKVTNPNDLRAIIGSMEGVTAGTENEIQNLPVGSALLCGIVDRPLIVNIRPRRSKHGGHAVDVLGSAAESSSEPFPDSKEEEYGRDIIEETKEFEEKGILPLIKPKLSVKDIKLMATQPIGKITTYLIPSVFFTCELHGTRINVLVDRIKGKIIINPDDDLKKDIPTIDEGCNFLRKPIFESIDFDVKLDERMTSQQLREELEKYCRVEDFKECFIVFRKVE